MTTEKTTSSNSVSNSKADGFHVQKTVDINWSFNNQGSGTNASKNEKFPQDADKQVNDPKTVADDDAVVNNDDGDDEIKSDESANF
jgi:hypothetical protein